MAGKMGKKYNHQQSFFNKTTFFPLLCSNRSSISIKDVKLTAHHPSYSSSSSSSATNPSSPKLGCIGLIRRNNKIIGFSSTPLPRLTSSSDAASATMITNTTKTTVVTTMLRRWWFSGRNVRVNVASSCTVAAVIGCGGSAGSGCAIRCSNSKVNRYTDGGNVSVDVEDLQPPVPVVIKNVSKPPEVNLWKRRCGGGVALKSLEPISR